jgi:hypothetical protein
MGSIYSGCSCVLIWIGRVRALSEDIAPLCKEFDILSAKLAPLPGDTFRLYEIQKKMLGMTKGSQSHANHCWEILLSGWFFRAWVFQEVILPPRSLIILPAGFERPSKSRSSLSLPTLHEMGISDWHHTSSTAYSRVQAAEKQFLAGDILREMLGRWKERHRPRAAYDPSYKPIEQILSVVTYGAKTTDIRDSIYAFCELNQDPLMSIVPSYEAAHPFRKALVSTFQSIVEGTKMLDVFEVIPRRALHNHLIDPHDEIPSWVPDLRLPDRVIPFRSAPTQVSPKYRWQESCDVERLRAHGRIVDNILHQLEAFPDHEPAFRYKRLLRDAHDELTAKIESGETRTPGRKEELMERLVHACVAENMCIWKFEYGFDVKATVAAFLHDSLKPERDAQEDQKSRRYHVFEIMAKVLKGRELWLTERRLLATGSDLQPGDCICILHGCTNPVALRKMRDPTNCYTVKSTCYLEG